MLHRAEPDDPGTDGLHAVNHVVDVADSDPGWVGPLDVAILTATMAVMAWLWPATAGTTEADRGEAG